MSAAAPARWMSPPAVAHQLGCAPEKIVALIKRGEIQASNIALNPLGRARYRISPESLSQFLQRRSAAPSPKPARRRKQSGQIVQFY